MPKRSNDFQKLIYLIHYQLADEAVVTESKFLHDSAANIDREVDIVIETQIGGYPIIISIECQGRGRTANIEWIEQMITKHKALPTDKLILVSKSNFSDSAYRKAKAYGVQILTLGQAIRADWNGIVGKTNKLEFNKFTVEHTAYFALTTQHNEQVPALVDANQLLYEKGGEEMLTIEETIHLLIDSHLVSISKQWKWDKSNKPGTYIIFTLDFKVPNGTYLIDALNNKYEIDGLRVLGHYTCQSEMIDLQHNSFGSAQIAFGKTQTVDAKSLISIVEREDKPNTAAIMQPSDNKNAPYIVNLRATQE